ncbi:polyphenol oxidase A1, chloroplastic-like [Magnolia sinica]|uniref:polyphenol oxidase A1, chloroplastic-like n=1 Tax=Magnolia sinica TaxID=86752 RepID=UPI002658F353|nr:polyphenol oxidase A1, chloroplastic-like [Magnolia sinica]
MSIASMMMSSLHVTASSAPSLHPKTFYSSRNASRRPTTCIRSSGDKSGEEFPLIKLDRRNMLIGIGGGLYGTTLGLGHDQKAAADPVGPPDLSSCHAARDLDTTNTTDYACCPPYTFPLPNPESIPSYKIPKNPILRKRKAIQMMTPDELYKFESAIAEMKKLDKTDPNNPWSFTQQAQIHCAYCNNAYYQYKTDKVPLEIHFSSLFLPWHRWYIYFFERILGKLIGDDSVALPYWNYDNPDGMAFPKAYDNPNSPLYDDLRNKGHAYARNYVDLNYGGEPYTPPPQKQLIDENLCYLQTIFNQGEVDPLQFIGCPIAAGVQWGYQYAGLLESLHNSVHQWTGPIASPNFDMGNFISAARDPIFYAHHSNVDRLWDIFRNCFLKTELETTSTDWLDASFVFYDENKELVKVNVKDSLRIDNLGYSYTSMPLVWKDFSKACKIRPKITCTATAVEFGSVPKALVSDPIRVLVKRPNSSRSKSEIQNTLEVVMVDGIEVEHTSSTRFDVFINTPSDNSTHLGDFVGSFTTVAHGHKHGETSDGNEKKLGLKLGITSMVSKLNAEDAESLVVSLVPRMGPVVVGGVRIEQIEKKTA